MGPVSASPPAVAAVIATVGDARFASLTACIRSLQACAVVDPSLEVIVVVDGGRLDTAALLTELDDPVTVLTTPQAGPATARNVGWRHTTAEVVAFVDDDTVVSPDWLTDIRSAFAAAPDLAGLGGRIEPLLPRNPVSRMMTDLGHLDHAANGGRCRLLTANAAFRRHALDAVAGFDERFTTAAGEDYDLCDRMWAAGLRLATTRGAVVYHRHPTTIGEMLATARRYSAALPDPAGDATSSTVAGKARRQLEKLFDATVRRGAPAAVTIAVIQAVFAVSFIARMPLFYARARRAPQLPGVPMAIIESMLEVLWRMQFVKATVTTTHGDQPTHTNPATPA
jgi:GT2 family glycosyltransferase